MDTFWAHVMYVGFMMGIMCKTISTTKYNFSF